MAGAIERHRLARHGVDHAATFSSASLTASSASWALEPSGPPPCAISGRPPPPWPPSVATAAFTRSTALTWTARSSVTPTATLARPSLTAISAPMPEPKTFLHVVNSRAQVLGIQAFDDLADEFVAVHVLGRRPRRTWTLRRPSPALFSRRQARARAGGAPRPATRCAQALRPAVTSASLPPRAAWHRARSSHWRAASPVSASIRRTPDETALSLNDLEQLDVAERTDVRAAA